MKVTHKLAGLISLGALLPVAAMATTSEQAYLKSCRKGPDVPVPIVVVAPQVGLEARGAAAEVEFLVDATGKPADISVMSSTDDALANAVVEAVKQWQFIPVQHDGVAVATKVALPFRVVDSLTEASN
jgi:TonB family protein